ncbi:MAG: tRNA (5-methylaminomethyl-2-thiouridylate)-methyltransferase [Pseudomonadota bacterium]
MSNETVRAVALVSGGLDSMLAVRMIQEQGVHVEAINFYTGFCIEGHTQAIRKKDQEKQKRNNALWVAEQLGIKLHIVDISAEYKDVVLNPRHGYGQNLNPCLDCKGFMVARAQEWMEAHGFDFIFTGEVVGQRPMSQRRETMPIIARESGAGDRLLRPLSARNLPATRPEREGWVDREQLGAISGRSRKEQMRLAREYGLEDYATPAGGCCFLTDEAYSRKLADLWQARGVRDYELDDIMLLKVGRHLRPDSAFKLIIGREKGENQFLRGYRNRFVSLEPTSHPGALALVDGNADAAGLELAARIAARYSQGRHAERVTFTVRTPEGDETTMTVPPQAPDAIPNEWIL